jgi:hypothetical protein
MPDRETSEKSGYRMLISLLQHWPISQRVNSFECLDSDPIAWNAPQFGVILQHIRSTYRRRAKRRHD